MGYKLEFNTVLSLPAKSLDPYMLVVGETYHVTKPGERLFPLNIPIDICDADYRFFAKIAVRKLTLTSGATDLDFEIIKVFNDSETQVITDNFAKHA